MRRQRIAIIGVLLTVMLLIASCQPVLAVSGKSGTRMAGNTQFETARVISESLVSGSVKNVILTSGNGFADALAASVLAHKLYAPILLTNRTVNSSNDAFDFITKHLEQTGTVYIVGGTGVINQDFETKLNQIGYHNIKRIAGWDQYETDYQIALELNAEKNTPVIIASGENYPDALAISGFAAYYGWPILLVKQNTLPDKIIEYVSSVSPSHIYIAGGTGVVSTNVQAQLQTIVPGTKITRVAGMDRFDTAGEIVKTFSPNPDNLYLATGYGFADALAGSVVAARNGDPIVLIDPKSDLPSAITEYLIGLYRAGVKPTINSFGGRSVVPDKIIADVDSILSGKMPTGKQIKFLQGSGYQAGAYDTRAAQPTEGNWSRQSSIQGPHGPEIQWSYETDGAISTSPAIGSDGTIYFGVTDNKFGVGKAQLYAVGTDGRKKWEFPIQVNVSSPIIGSDGTIYAGSGDGNLYSINPDGTKKWSFSAKGLWSKASPSIGADGTIYTASSIEAKVFALDQKGSKKWEFQCLGDYLDTTPAIANDGTIYVGSSNGKLYALTSQGTKKWEAVLGTASCSSVAIGPDGTVYVGTADNKLMALTSAGSKKWEVEVSGPIESIPAIGSNGMIYLAVSVHSSNGAGLCAIGVDGKKVWESLKGIRVSSSQIIGSDGIVYVGAYDQKLYGIKPDGSKEMEFLTGGIISASPAIGQNGILYIGAYDSRLYAIGQ